MQAQWWNPQWGKLQNDNKNWAHWPLMLKLTESIIIICSYLLHTPRTLFKPMFSQKVSSLNSITTVGYLLGVFFRLWIHFGVYFHFCLELASTENLSQSFTDTLSVALWPQPHQLTRQLPCARHLMLTRWVLPVPTKAFLWPAKAAAMCMAPHAETHPPPTFFG